MLGQEVRNERILDYGQVPQINDIVGELMMGLTPTLQPLIWRCFFTGNWCSNLLPSTKEGTLSKTWRGMRGVTPYKFANSIIYLWDKSKIQNLLLKPQHEGMGLI